MEIKDNVAANPLSAHGMNTYVDPLGVQSIRQRLYDNIVPFGYNDPFTRVTDALVFNKPEKLREETDYNIKNNVPIDSALDDIWATYLNIPEQNRRQINPNLGITKQPSGHYSFTSPGTTLAQDIDEALGRYPNTMGPGLFEGEQRQYMNGILGNYIMGKDYDDKGSYLYYSDSKLNPDGTPNLSTGWDINPFSNTTDGMEEEDGSTESGYGLYGQDLNNIGYKIGNKLFGNIEDLSMGIGTPVPIYGKMYLDDIYGIKTNGDHWLPEVVVTPNNHAEGGELNGQPTNPYGTGTKAQYDHVTGIYQALVDEGIDPQAALDITNQKVAERGWSGYSTGDKKVYPNAKKFAEHIKDWHGRMYPDSLHSKDFNSYWRGIMDGKHQYNPYYDKYKNDLLKTRPGVKKRINTYRAKQGLGPLVLNTGELMDGNFAANGGNLFDDGGWNFGKVKNWFSNKFNNIFDSTLGKDEVEYTTGETYKFPEQEPKWSDYRIPEHGTEHDERFKQALQTYGSVDKDDQFTRDFFDNDVKPRLARHQKDIGIQDYYDDNNKYNPYGYYTGLGVTNTVDHAFDIPHNYQYMNKDKLGVYRRNVDSSGKIIPGTEQIQLNSLYPLNRGTYLHELNHAYRQGYYGQIDSPYYDNTGYDVTEQEYLRNAYPLDKTSITDWGADNASLRGTIAQKYEQEHGYVPGPDELDEYIDNMDLQEHLEYLNSNSRIPDYIQELINYNIKNDLPTLNYDAVKQAMKNVASIEPKNDAYINLAANGGNIYTKGSEHDLSKEEIDELIKQGYKIEYV